MGLFARRPINPVDGIVDRIGITYFSDVTQTYTILLEDGRSFLVDSGVGAAKRERVNPEIAMAKPGDHVRFGLKDGDTHASGYFLNLTMKPLETTSKP